MLANGAAGWQPRVFGDNLEARQAVKHETIVRLIEGASPEQLRVIARLALRLSGYAASRITDGPYDGGTDLVVKDAAGGTLPLAVAISVERDWQKKLRKDVSKARQKLGVQHVLVVSSRRIPEGSFRTVQAELADASGVRVDRLDQQALADLVMDHNALPELLGALDISIAGEHAPTTPAARRRDAAYAYAFFAPEVHSFHQTMRERSLMVALAQAGGGAKISELCMDASRLLGMDAEDSMSLIHDLDRLRQQGRIHGHNGTVGLTEGERETMRALSALRQREEDLLRHELETLVNEVGLSPPDDALNLLLRGLGALVARHIGAPEALEHLRTQVRRLRRELQSLGLPEGERGDQFIERAIERARISEFGQSLAMGSVYQALTSLDRGALLQALDARSITLVLDASVAIPMLCALFHGSVEQRFFIVAEELHRRSRRAGIALALPDVWLEEMASHLLRAREYVAFVDDEDLRQSNNAYVAYFAGSRRFRAVDFDEFLDLFGLTEGLARRAEVDRDGARRELEQFLRQQLAHYDISVVPTRASKHHLDRAKKDWDWACHVLDVGDRPSILANHDRRVLAWLSESVERDPTHALLVVTWDRILRRARPENAPGGALDPLAISELLSFLAGAREPAITTRFVSLQLTEAEAERGSTILDALVGIEHGRLSDAELAQTARAFKQAYVRDHTIQSSRAELERAWLEFKGSSSQ